MTKNYFAFTQKMYKLMSCQIITQIKHISCTAGVDYSYLTVWFQKQHGQLPNSYSFLTVWCLCQHCFSSHSIIYMWVMSHFIDIYLCLTCQCAPFSPLDPMSAHSSKSWGPRRSTSVLVVTGTKGPSVERKRKCLFCVSSRWQKSNLSTLRALKAISVTERFTLFASSSSSSNYY